MNILKNFTNADLFVEKFSIAENYADYNTEIVSDIAQFLKFS